MPQDKWAPFKMWADRDSINGSARWLRVIAGRLSSCRAVSSGALGHRHLSAVQDGQALCQGGQGKEHQAGQHSWASTTVLPGTCSPTGLAPHPRPTPEADTSTTHFIEKEVEAPHREIASPSSHPGKGQARLGSPRPILSLDLLPDATHISPPVSSPKQTLGDSSPHSRIPVPRTECIAG